MLKRTKIFLTVHTFVYKMAESECSSSDFFYFDDLNDNFEEVLQFLDNNETCSESVLENVSK